MTSRPLPLLALCLFLAATTPGCRGSGGSGEELQGVVVVLLDTVRADHLGCYGYERATSPALDALAADGVRFAQAASSAPWTLPSVSAMLAGQYPERVFRGKLQASLVETLQAAGVATAGFTEGAYVSRAFAHDRGFDQFEEEEGAVQVFEPGEQRDPTAAGGIERTFARAERWLSEVGEKRFFLLVHTYEPHAPYTNRDFTDGLAPGRIGAAFTIEHVEGILKRELVLTEAEQAYVTALYDGDLLNSDRYIECLRDRLRELGMDERVAVVVTSDHGEELGDHYPHNFGDHGHGLLDPHLLVPLIVHDPTRTYEVKVVDAQVRLIDVMPTVIDLLGVAPGRPLDGRSLVPLMTGEERDDRVALVGQTKLGPLRVGLRAMGHKYIQVVSEGDGRFPLHPPPPQQQLYDLGADPGEQTNLAAERAEMVEMLAGTLRNRHPGFSRHISPSVANQADPKLVERLRSLGYLR